MHSLVTLVRGEEAEENNLLPHPGQRGGTPMSHRGGKENHVPTLKLEGLDTQSVMVSQVAAQVPLQMILVREDKRH